MAGTGRLASTLLIVLAASPAASQLVTGHTLCEPKLPLVLTSSQYPFQFWGDRAHLSGDGAIRFEYQGGSAGVGLYRFEDNDRLAGHYQIQLGLFLDGKGGVVVREHQNADKKVGDAAVGDIFEIAIVNGAPQYIRNGETLHVSSQNLHFPFELTLCGDSAPAFVLSKEWNRRQRYNQPPVPVARASRRRVPGKPIRFDASRSTDEDGRIKRYQWDFGDGTKAKGVTVDHTYELAGYYIVKLRVMDEALETAETLLDMSVEVEPDPPAARPVPPAAMPAARPRPTLPPAK
jgi:hypothetical protein